MPSAEEPFSIVEDTREQDAGTFPRPGRFRDKVRSIIKARSFLHDVQSAGLRIPGAAPGVDVNAPNPALEALFSEDVCIQVTDYSADRLEVTFLDPSTIEPFLNRKRPSWSKVRWVDVKGINFPAIKIIADKYKLHPLAVEDVFHFPQTIKTDWYDSHIYVSMILPSLARQHSDDIDIPSDTESVYEAKLSTSISADKLPVPHGMRRLFPVRPNVGMDRGSHDALVPDVFVEQCNLFLLREGTFVTIFQHDGRRATSPIYTRLEEKGTVMRDCQDASFLMFAVMDAVTDHFFPVVDAYRKELDWLEMHVLGNPKAEATKELHLIAKELGSLRRTIMPTRTLITSLREAGKHNFQPSSPEVAPPEISRLTRTYLSDVKDHIDMVLDALESFENDAGRLSDLIFNSISHSTNEAMKTLAVVSLVFLPISFLAGVFGMNFDHFPELHWKIGVYGYVADRLQ
ncbi:hypothetical protein HDU85_002653 [Gaertneriomyces sp. JEL0708]|nr:hypothetical protein HDU85_002653 [Gaertneriomyces sp. JEL0708]